jgi:fructoselysine-6-P-deglycase FrlB-like protein
MTTDRADARSHVRREIGEQPKTWAKAVGLVPELATVLPRPGERVAVICCGTSWFMAGAYAALREESGIGETDAFPASQFPASRDYDRVLAISRSGTTTEVVRALAATTAPTVAITAVAHSPVVDAASDAVVLDFADELSVVQTVFATTTLMLLRASLGDSVANVIEQCESVLEQPSPLAREVVDAEQFTFLGQGWAYGIAQEAALKMREAAQLWTEAYPQMEYRHGPIAIAQPGRAVWVFGDAMPGLLDDVRATGAAVVSNGLDPLADLVHAQLLAVRRAEAARLDPDQPRRLTRSVVLAST